MYMSNHTYHIIYLSGVFLNDVLNLVLKCVFKCMKSFGKVLEKIFHESVGTLMTMVGKGFSF